MKYKRLSIVAGVLLLAMQSGYSFAQQTWDALHQVQQRWAEVNYTLQDDAQEQAFLALIEQAKALTTEQPENAAGWVWLGISESSTAGAVGGLGALDHAERAKEALEKAMSLDADVLQGSAKTSLGVLYHKVPGWPFGFGSDKKANRLLQAALAVNPEGIDPNYFYGEFLYDKRDYQKAKYHLEMALNAPDRPDRPLADQYRREEVKKILAKVSKKLKG